MSDHDSQMLKELHQMVATLCQRFGDDPADVPCDIWRLAEHLTRCKQDAHVLATAWDLVSRNGRAGWDEQLLDAADAARNRQLYPTRNPTETT